MASAMLPIIRANAEYDLNNILPLVLRGNMKKKLMDVMCRAYRTRGLCSFLLEGSPQQLRTNLQKSGAGFLHWLIQAQDAEKITSQAKPFFDAVASGDLNGARDIAAHSRPTWNQAEEYEDDFLYVFFLMKKFYLNADVQECVDLIDSFEKVLDGADSLRFDICKAYLDLDEQGFDEALGALALEHQDYYQSGFDRDEILEEDWATEGQLFVEGLALVRWAERLGFHLPDDYLLMPSLARMEVDIPSGQDTWRSLCGSYGENTLKMGHPEIKNETPLAFESLYLADEEGRPLLVPVVKATYAIAPGERLSLADEQVPVNLAGEHWDDPETTSYKYEPETAFIKPATDVVLIGHAYAPQPGATEVLVRLRVGPVEKTVRVVGDRYWTKILGSIVATEPRPFERIPLVYERSYGGWDRRDPDPEKHQFEPRNPVGTGFLGKRNHFEEGIRLPNLEDPSHPLKRWKNRPAPLGFGFTCPHWQPRAALAGTYDEDWTKNRMPLLPTDFDRRFFNAASEGLIASGFLRGNESVMIENATPDGRLVFNLPGLPPPHCRVELRDGRAESLQTQLDTVIINLDEKILLLLWRTNLVLRSGPEDVTSIEIASATVPAATANK